MLKISLKNLAANKIRLALTALAIVLGVGFVSSANVLSDGLRESFANLSAEIVQGTDLQVDRDFETDLVEIAPITDSEIAAVEGVDGVRVASGQLGADEFTVIPVRPDGTIVESVGPPILAFAWETDEQLNPAAIEEGRAPEGPGEWIIDLDSAEREGFVIGETHELIVPTAEGSTTAELVGTFRFGQENQTNGAVLIAFETDEAFNLFDRTEFDAISIAIDGSRPVADVRADIENELGPGYVTQDTAELNAETAAEFNQFIDVFAWVLRSFAIVALFVSIFIIANTFNIVMSQRVRELGLLRAVGATPRQVRSAVLVEALIVGLIASAIGLIVGLGLAFGVEAFLNAVGAELPDFSKTLSIPTILIGLAVGVIVTLLSAWLPARRAGSTPPVTAISGTDAGGPSGRRSTILGAVLVAIGGTLTGVSLFGGIDSTATLLGLLGIGAATLMIGLTLVSSLVAAPISRALGAPIAAVYKRPGVLAKENAARNPRRTATTAAALMIGLSLVSMAFVVGETLRSDLTELVETTVQADFAIFPRNDIGLVPAAVLDDLEASPDLESAAGIKYWNTTIDHDGSSTGIAASQDGVEVGTVPFERIDAVLDLDLIEGSYEAIDDDSLAIRDTVADDLGAGLGDVLEVQLFDGSTADLEIAAIFEDGTIFTGTIVTEARWDTIGDQDNAYDWVAVSAAVGSTAEASDLAITEIGSDFPQVVAQSAAEFVDEVSGQVDMFLFVLTGFLGLAILIAFIGIVNTMALSVFERTRELGLLRAVGMTRKQMHKMVRWEAAIVSSVGALFGAVVGIVFGILVVIATPDFVLNNLAIPWLSLAVLVIIAGLIGLLAGFFPARRAGKLNVLDAIG